MNELAGRYADGLVHLAVGNHYPLPEAWQARLTQHNLANGDVILGIRPEAARISSDGALKTEVYADALHGAYTMLHLALDGERGAAMAHVRADKRVSYPIGTPLHFDLDPHMVRFFDPKTELALEQ